MITINSEQAASLPAFVSRQINNILPDADPVTPDHFVPHMEEALFRTDNCISSVRGWRERGFSHLYSLHYCTFLYFLSNTIWRSQGNSALCDKLFQLNKTLNGIEISYEAQLPDRFAIGHSVGTVLTKRGHYGDYLVLFQNCTIGQSEGEAPVIGEGVVLYPGSSIIGRSNISRGTVVSQGVSIINRDTVENARVFSGVNGEIIQKIKPSSLIDRFFF